MEVPLTCLTKTHLLSTIAGNDIPSVHEIVKNDGQFDKFKSLAVLYNIQNFKCLEQESFNDVLYIKLATSICNLIDFSMLIVYRKNNSNIEQFVGYITFFILEISMKILSVMGQ